MHAIFEREEVPAEQTTSRPDPVETKPAAAKGNKKGKGRARKEPAEAEEDRKEPKEELGFLEEGLLVPEEGTVSRKRSLSDLLGSDAGEPSDADAEPEPAEPPGPATRLRHRGGR